jgi:ABC-2 type transport system ATP-binding protein
VDPVRRRHLWREVRALAQRGATVLLVTHNVIEAERSVDRLAILDHGRVVAHGTPAELKASTADELRIDLTLEPGAQPPAIPAFASRAIPAGSRLVVTVPVSATSEAAAWATGERRAGRVEEFSLGPATLEDVYVALAAHAEVRPLPGTRREGATDVRAA